MRETTPYDKPDRVLFTFVYVTGDQPQIEVDHEEHFAHCFVNPSDFSFYDAAGALLPRTRRVENTLSAMGSFISSGLAISKIWHNPIYQLSREYLNPMPLHPSQPSF